MMKEYKKDKKGFLGGSPGCHQAQAVLEFTTAAIAFIMLAYGMIQILRWAPKMLYERTDAHDACMKNSNMSVACMGTSANTSLNVRM